MLLGLILMKQPYPSVHFNAIKGTLWMISDVQKEYFIVSVDC